MGVLSLMARTSKPAVASARMADSRPDPGPLTRTSTVRRPTSLAFEAAVIDACCAAKGVPLRAPGTLPGARVGVGALPANRETAPVPQPAIGAHLDVPLDIHRDFLAQVAFDGAFLFQDLADVVHFLLAQIAHFLVEMDPCPVEQ